jgi:hypothetical protein
MQRAQLEILQLARGIVKDEKILLSEAIRRVCADHLGLAREYRQEVLATHTDDLTPTSERQEVPQGPAAREVARLVKTQMASEAVTATEALKAVGRTHPVLMSAYRREITGARN